MRETPGNPTVKLSKSDAAAMVERWLGREVSGVERHRLTGGCVHTVFELEFEGPESPVVLKVAGGSGVEAIADEYEILRYYEEETQFPVPEPLFCDISGEGASEPYSYLIMERIPGRHLGQVTLDAEQHIALQRELARAVVDLHEHKRETYGNLTRSEEYDNWAECFGAKLEHLYRQNERVGLLCADAMEQVRRVIDGLAGLLDAPGEATLTHGDIWATNVMVQEGRLAGILDPGDLFAHREYELAYLEIWHTADQHFFEVYYNAYPRLEGYERRRNVYWLATLLIHVWFFQSRHYVEATERLVSEMAGE